VVSYYRAFAPKSEAVKYMDYLNIVGLLSPLFNLLIETTMMYECSGTIPMAFQDGFVHSKVVSWIPWSIMASKLKTKLQSQRRLDIACSHTKGVKSWQNLAGGSVITCRIPNFYLTSSYRAIASYLKVVWPSGVARAQPMPGHSIGTLSLRVASYPGSAQLLRLQYGNAEATRGVWGCSPRKFWNF